MTRYRKRNLLWLLPLLVSVAAAQRIDTANGPKAAPQAISLSDEIQDLQERAHFKELMGTQDPRQARQRAVDFVKRYPSSLVLREAYEVAARASAALGDDNGALEWGKRALRLLPENPALLVLIADMAAQQGQHQLAKKSGVQALRFLERALAPTTVPSNVWPQVRDDLRNQAYFALGRTAVEEKHYADAERWLLDALRLKPNDYNALFVLGVARFERDPESAASSFAQVMKVAGGAAAENGRRWLQRVYSAKTRSQTFEQFAASQRWSLPLPTPASPASPAGAYAGSTVCGQCHQDQYSSWQSTGMAKMFRPYSADDVMGRFSGETVLDGNARPVAENGQHFIELRNVDSGKWVRYKVDAMIGSKWQQAYASMLPDGRLVVLPIQYSKLEGGWLNFWRISDGGSVRSDVGHFQGVPEGSLYQKDCAPCHTSQLSYAGASPLTARFREGGIDCEMCHGPSKAHADAGGAYTGARAPSGTQLPLDFRGISAEQSVAICAQCHKQSLAHDPGTGGAVNYSIEGPFYRAYSSRLLSNYNHKVFYADGRFRVTTFIGEALERSRCFLEGGATCVSCHNPHPDDAVQNPKSLKFAPDSDEMCLQCHSTLRDRPEQHTRHAPGSEASRCVSCHMPRNMEALMFQARSHQIDEIPDAEMTSRFGAADSPNACLGCHRDKDVRWLAESMAARRDGR